MMEWLCFGVGILLVIGCALARGSSAGTMVGGYAAWRRRRR